MIQCFSSHRVAFPLAIALFVPLTTAPANAQDAEEMSAGEDQCVAAQSAKAGDDAVGSGADIGHAFTPGAAVAKQVPIGALPADLGRCHPVIIAVVPLD